MKQQQEEGVQLHKNKHFIHSNDDLLTLYINVLGGGNRIKRITLKHSPSWKSILKNINDDINIRPHYFNYIVLCAHSNPREMLKHTNTFSLKSKIYSLKQCVSLIIFVISPFFRNVYQSCKPLPLVVAARITQLERFALLTQHLILPDTNPFAPNEIWDSPLRELNERDCKGETRLCEPYSKQVSACWKWIIISTVYQLPVQYVSWYEKNVLISLCECIY